MRRIEELADRIERYPDAESRAALAYMASPGARGRSASVEENPNIVECSKR
jgi:hypothetical protein